MATRNYGKRECLQCGKTFEAQYPHQITCTRECQKARTLKLSNERRDKYIRSLKQLRVEMKELRRANDTLSDLLESTQNELKAAMEELARLKGKPGKRAA